MLNVYRHSEFLSHNLDEFAYFFMPCPLQEDRSWPHHYRHSHGVHNHNFALSSGAGAGGWGGTMVTVHSSALSLSWPGPGTGQWAGSGLIINGPG